MLLYLMGVFNLLLADFFKKSMALNLPQNRGYIPETITSHQVNVQDTTDWLQSETAANNHSTRLTLLHFYHILVRTQDQIICFSYCGKQSVIPHKSVRYFTAGIIYFTSSLGWSKYNNVLTPHLHGTPVPQRLIQNFTKS